MLTLFLKKLATDTSAEENSRIKTILEQNDIKFEVNITHTKMRSYAESQVKLGGTPVMHGVAPQPIVIYSIYVKRQDFARAKKLVWG